MIYADNAATTFPKPPSVIRAVQDCLTRYCANPGRSGHYLSLQAGKMVYDTRAALSTYCGVDDPLRFAFTSGSTLSLNMAILGMVKPGSHVITTMTEHNSVVRPLYQRRTEDITTTYLPLDGEGLVDPEGFRRSLQTNTALFICSHVSNLTGAIQPVQEIAAIAEEKGIPLLIDGAQSMGLLSMKGLLNHSTLLAFSGHKGLMGPQGTGVLYVGQDITLKPLLFGGTGSISESLEQPDWMPDMLESGTVNTPGIAGLQAALQYNEKLGASNLLSHERQLTEQFLQSIEGIKEIKLYGPKNLQQRVGVVALNIGDMDSSQVAGILNDQYGIAVRGGLHCTPLTHRSFSTLKQGMVRFSFGYYNTLREVNFISMALQRITHLT